MYTINIIPVQFMLLQICLDGNIEYADREILWLYIIANMVSVLWLIMVVI